MTDLSHDDRYKAIVGELADSLTDKGIEQWMQARNRLLGGDRPIDRLEAGDFLAVQKAAQSFSYGVYV